MQFTLVVFFHLSSIVLGVHQTYHKRSPPVEKEPRQSEINTPINHDYVYSSQFVQREAPLPLPVLHGRTQTASKGEYKKYEPREDPKLFYQSPAYLKRQNDKANVNLEVAAIYPGQDVVRAPERRHPRVRVARERMNRYSNARQDYKLCIKCPQDKALIAKPGSDRVYFDPPRLKQCSGYSAPNSVRFVHVFGPKFGSLIEQGTHSVIGKIVRGHEMLNYCKMQVNVVTQGCYTPKHLISNCGGRHCNFTCSDPNLKLIGPTVVECGFNMKWTNELPICRARSWCEAIIPPDYGRISCQGATAGAGGGLAEGTRCRVRCQRGWRPSRTAAVCRRGLWSQELACYPKRPAKSV